MEKLLQRNWVNPYIPKAKNLVENFFSVESIEKITEVEVADLKSLINQKAETHNLSCIILELGSGSGAHLIELARRNPTKLCIGFEIRFKRGVRTVEKALQQGIENIFVIRCKGQEISKIFNKHSVEQLYINFPDPWAKNHQKKHRIISTKSLEKFVNILTQNGEFYFKTDHREYFDSVVKLINNSNFFSSSRVSYDLFNDEKAKEWMEESIPTEFEKLFRSQNKPIHYMMCKPNPRLQN